MLAFTGTEVTKPRLIASLEAHAAANRIKKGQYWQGRGDGRGCAVGCSIHDFRPGAESEHALYETLFGVPKHLARLEDGIFESLPEEDALKWPLRFVRAIPEGADLSLVWPRFAHWLLVDESDGVWQYGDDQGKQAIEQVAALYARWIDGDKPAGKEWEAARAAAWAAAGEAAWDAAWAAARAAARDAAWAAAGEAAWDAAWEAARAAARDAARRKQADQLVKLLAQARSAHPGGSHAV